MQHPPGRHGQLVSDAAGGAHLAGLARQLSGEALGHTEVAGHADQAVGHRFLGVVDGHRVIIREAAAALPAVEHEPTLAVGPGDVHRSGQEPAPVHHADGRREHGQSVHEVGGAVQWIQHPEHILGQLLGLQLFLGALFPQDTVLGKTLRDLGGQVLLDGLVGGGYGIPFVLIFELDGYLTAKVLHENLARAPGNLHCLAFNVLGLSGHRR